uniref:CARD domain-containing protein n=1 Tax=Scleropages formosus TaxID=113540 RepID=A0A8C9WFJ1_SCLFO
MFMQFKKIYVCKYDMLEFCSILHPEFITLQYNTDQSASVFAAVQYVDSNRAELIQRVVAVMPIADELLQRNMIHRETYNNILTAGTSQKQMRLLYSILDSAGDTVKSAFHTFLKNNCPHLVQASVSEESGGLKSVRNI